MRRENEIQRAIVDYLRAVVPHCVVMAIPNGAPRTQGGRAANAVPGLTPGAPDLCMALTGGRIVWLEIKSEKGRVRDNQLALHMKLSGIGHNVAILRSIDDARNMLKALNIKTREADG